MTLHAPQIIYLFLVFAGFGFSCYYHDKPKTGNHNVWVDMAAAALQFGLLYWGGFFK